MLTIRRLALLTIAVVLLPAHAGWAAVVSPKNEIRLDPTSRIVEGRVATLVYRTDENGYPVTDVALEPGGERFTVLGGERGGVRWIAEEEAQFHVDDWVRVRLQRGRLGWRPEGGETGVELRIASADLEFLPQKSRLDEYGTPALVDAVIPASGPAVGRARLLVEIRGRNFGSRQESGRVFFLGLFEHVRANVVEWSDRRIIAEVPRPGLFGRPQIMSGAVKVVAAGGGWSNQSEWTGGAEYEVLFQFPGDTWVEDQLPIRYWLNPEGFPWPLGLVESKLRQAVREWESVPHGHARFEYQGRTDAPAVRALDGKNSIGWTSPWPHPSGWLAVTWSAIDLETGTRLESDIEVNGEQPWSISEESVPDHYDFHTVMLHEFGHWIRLGHVQERNQAMASFQTRARLQRTLGEGDRQGATWAYPTYGSVVASRDSVFFGGDNPDTLILDIQVVDRRGRPVADLPTNEVFAFAHQIGDSPTKLFARSDYGLGGDLLHAVAPTDKEGRTKIIIPEGRGEGQVRFVVSGGEHLLLQRPEVFVSEQEPPVFRLPLFTLSAVSPNPAMGHPVRASVELARAVPRLLARLFDGRGRVVRVIHDAPADAGRITFDLVIPGAAKLPPGLYLLEVRSENLRQTRKFVLLGG